jgi:hypothetical protein
MKVISDRMKDEIRFQSNYLHLKGTLLVLNHDRFTALGDAGCQAFVRHGVKVADGFHLSRMDSAAYTLLLMSFLGGWFHTDPRYAAITDALAGPGAETTKINDARAAFMAHANHYIGDRGEISARILGGYQPQLDQVTNTQVALPQLHQMLIQGCPFTAADRAAYPQQGFEDEAVKAAAHLGLDQVLGPKVCLVLTFILGRQFFDDPLYPWVRDKIAEAAKSGADPARHLFDYAVKRMRLTILKAEVA